MFGEARIAVVVPAFNEASLIGRTLRSVPGFVDEIVVVDDASDDDTASIALSLDDPRITVIVHGRNRGVGAAIRTGYAVAFAGGSDIAAVMAGDGQMDPEDLLLLVDPIIANHADYVTGDRLSHPNAHRLMPRIRWVGNHVLGRLTRWITGLPVRDSQCGYTALSRRAATRLALDALWPRYGYPNDLLGAAQRAGLRFQHVVVRPVYGHERSGITLWHALVVIPFVLARVLWRRLGLAR